MNSGNDSLRRLAHFLRGLALAGLVCLGLAGQAAAQTTLTFDSSGTWTAPAGVTSVTVEAWGGGGGGGDGSSGSNYGGGGGGGGAYASSVLTVTPGTTYTITIGDGGTNGANGTSGGTTSFGGTLVVAAGGSGGSGVTGGNGGTTAASTGTTKYAGCKGGNGQTSTSGTEAGGGGGGSPDSSGTCTAGGNASGTTAGTDGTGDGDGGLGGYGSTDGEDGAQPGGGGGGGSADSGSAGGLGGDGRIVLTFTIPPEGGVTGSCTTSTVGSDTLVTCTGNGTFTVPANVTKLRYLVVAGGGGGGGIESGDAYGSGGGGAGGVRAGSGLAVTAGTTYSITVGAGGAGGIGGTSRGGNGGNSVFGTITAIGGGGGASQNVSSNTGASGGSGGGGRNTGTGGSGTAGQGNSGGDGDGSDWWGGSALGGGGGGGGAGASGADGSGSNGGSGGTGIVNDINGTTTIYGGGGGGGRYGSGTAGSGGSGGGGSAPAARGAGTAATANTGGGGGAASGSSSGSAYSGGAGGSGVVMLRYTPGLVCATFRDEFASASYSRNDGNANWTGNWIETGDNSSPTGGTILITKGRLQLKGNGSGGSATFGGPSVEREANLSTYATATLTFDYSESGTWESDDYMDVYVSKDGGASWTKIKAFQDDQGSATQSFSYDVSAYIAGNFRIAFVEKASKKDEIFYIDNVQVEACKTTGGLDHIRIEHSGSGVSCLREAVTIKACQTADCATQYTAGSVALNLSPSGNWYSAATGGTASDALTFTGSATRYFEKTAAGTVTLSASGVSPAATNGVKCYVGATENCSLVFTDAGFVVAAAAGGDEATVPTQTAGTESAQYWLRAVKKSTTTQACEAALTGATTVTLAYGCNDPASCYTTDAPACGSGSGYLCLTPYSSNGATAQTASPLAPGGTSVSLNFDANGNAPFTFNYRDVGSITLTATKAAGGSLLASLSGSSNAFVVRPDRFLVRACTGTTPCTTDNAAATDGTGPTFVRAGAAFNATISAITAGGAVTPSFGGGTTAASETVALTPALVAPVGGKVGTLGGPGTGASCAPAPQANCLYRSAFNNGVASVTGLTWSEVGVMTLAAQNTTFHGTTVTTTGTSGNVGRFFPDHFDTEVTHGCVVGTFTYSAQPFSVKVTAKEKNGGVTQNYGGSSWAYLTTLSDAGTTTNFSGNTIANTAFSKGVGTATGVTYTLASPPSGGASTLKLRAVDSDGVSSSGHTEGTTALRFGRLWLGNAFGSDQRSLTIPYELQYWNGNAFVKNTDDGATCTTLSRANIGLFNYLGGVSETNVTVANNLPASIANTGGGGTITLTPPTTAGDLANVAGSVDLVVNLGATTTPAIATTWTDLNAANRDPNDGPTGAERPWLRSRWYGTAWDRDPTARATFGVFGSSQRRGPIYIRESY